MASVKLATLLIRVRHFLFASKGSVRPDSSKCVQTIAKPISGRIKEQARQCVLAPPSTFVLSQALKAMVSDMNVFEAFAWTLPNSCTAQK